MIYSSRYAALNERRVFVLKQQWASIMIFVVPREAIMQRTAAEIKKIPSFVCSRARRRGNYGKRVFSGTFAPRPAFGAFFHTALQFVMGP